MNPVFIISSLNGYGLKKLCKDISLFLFNKWIFMALI
jgi:hypothetical protein